MEQIRHSSLEGSNEGEASGKKWLHAFQSGEKELVLIRSSEDSGLKTA